MKDLKKRLKAMSSWRLQGLSRRLDSLARPTRWMKSKFKLIYSSRGSMVVWVTMILFSLAGLLLSSVFSQTYSKFLFFLVAQGMMAVSTLILDNYVFGRYTYEGIKERRQWEAFRALLSDTAQMQKYEPEDMSMWGDWLVFATAFGCADKVLKRMEKLQVKLPYVPSYSTNYMFYSFMRSTTHTQLAAKTASSAGGFSGGVGGGFGGGGGGAR